MVRTWHFASISARAALLALALLGAVSIGAAAPARANERSAVLKANEGFYKALNEMFQGNVEPMIAVWSHANDVTYMGPTGNFEHGWDAVLKDWQGQAAMKLGGIVTPEEISPIVGKDVAVVSDYEKGENTNAKGQVERLRLRATNIFRKEHGVWKMVGHHTDTLPYLAK
ncbi:MAG TPA: nuclear transport factor 2 family protein [Alphaproteobacteria bacterium]|nr:nuclear transport factor 2 family protein [Alphaproteobacteria bacterium]